MRNRILIGDVREMLREIPDESVHCVVTSPPYWGLRDYGAVGQLGLEGTPEEYVANMVAVFRELRRVLRKDGSVWLNLGDSYTSGGRGSYDTALVSASSGLRNAAATVGSSRPGTPSGLKPKDLVGIPWLVAKALQSPYYTGRIKDERDRVWLAAMIDGEGCMFIHKRKIGQNNGQGYARKSDTYGSGLEIANTSEAIVRRCMAITGRGSIVRQEKARRQPLYRWNLRSNECREVIREIYPYLVGKQKQARLVMGCPSSGPDAEAAHAGLIGLHGGVDCAIDFKEPPSMYEQGWYLRSDVIWSKLNPMPESVTDRPTKSHEYIFLLTKSERYFYDQEAVREPFSPVSIARISQPNFENQKGGAKDYGPDSNRSMRKTLENFAKSHRGSTFTDGKTAASHANVGQGERVDHGGRNKRTVWEIATQPYEAAHFATYPEALVKPCILAGTSEHGCCAECGAPWERVVEKSYRSPIITTGTEEGRYELGRGRNVTRMGDGVDVTTTGWRPTCTHEAPVVPCLVLDPFLGSGTTALVAKNAGRDWLGIELNPDYVKLAEERIKVAQERLL